MTIKLQALIKTSDIPSRLEALIEAATKAGRIEGGTDKKLLALVAELADELKTLNETIAGLLVCAHIADSADKLFLQLAHTVTEVEDVDDRMKMVAESDAFQLLKSSEVRGALKQALREVHVEDNRPSRDRDAAPSKHSSMSDAELRKILAGAFVAKGGNA